MRQQEGFAQKAGSRIKYGWIYLCCDAQGRDRRREVAFHMECWLSQREVLYYVAQLN
jgi:hypothetical protein